jgi:hypothetical protein
MVLQHPVLVGKRSAGNADVLALTKLNFNTCLFNDRKPVTIRFADAIGDILVAAPIRAEPRLPFKFYI